MIVNMELLHAMMVVHHLRDIDREELMAVRWTSSLEQIAIDAWSAPGVKHAVLNASQMPVAIFGVAFDRPKTGSAWMIATNEIQSVRIELTKACEYVVSTLLKKELHRITAASIATHHEAHAWLETVGFVRESEMPGYGQNGETFINFAAMRA